MNAQVPSDPWFCVMNDDDGHWYVILSTERDRFNRWIEAVGSGEPGDRSDWIRFHGQCRIDGPHSIEFPSWRNA